MIPGNSTDAPTHDTQADRALREADRMRLMAGQYKQMGFKEIARFLRKNADAAMKWAVAQVTDDVR